MFTYAVFNFFGLLNWTSPMRQCCLSDWYSSSLRTFHWILSRILNLERWGMTSWTIHFSSRIPVRSVFYGCTRTDIVDTCSRNRTSNINLRSVCLSWFSGFLRTRNMLLPPVSTGHVFLLLRSFYSFTNVRWLVVTWQMIRRSHMRLTLQSNQALCGARDVSFLNYR